MEIVNAITKTSQGGPLGMIVGNGVAHTLVGCALLIAKCFGVFDDAGRD